MKCHSCPGLLSIGAVLTVLLLMFTSLPGLAAQPAVGPDRGEALAERLAGLDAVASRELIVQLDAAGQLTEARAAARLALAQYAEDAPLHLLHAWLHDEAALLRPAIASYLAVLRLTADVEAVVSTDVSQEWREGESLELPAEADQLRGLAQARLQAIRPWLDADQGEALDAALGDLGIDPTPAPAPAPADPQAEPSNFIQGQVRATLNQAEAQQRAGSSTRAQQLLIRALNLSLRSPERSADSILLQVAQRARRWQVAEPMLSLLQTGAADEPLRLWLAVRLALLADQETAVPPLLAELFARAPRPPYGGADYLLALQRDDPAAAPAVLAQLSSSEREAAVELLLAGRGMAHSGLLRLGESGSQALLAALLASLDPLSFGEGQWVRSLAQALAANRPEGEAASGRHELLRELLRWPRLAEWAFAYLYAADPDDEHLSSLALQALSHAARREWPASLSIVSSQMADPDQLLLPPTLYLAQQSIERADGDEAVDQWREQLSAAAADQPLAQLLALRALLQADAAAFPQAAAGLLAQLEVLPRPALDQAIPLLLIKRGEALIGAAALAELITAPHQGAIAAWAGWFEDSGLAAQVPTLIDHWLAQQPAAETPVNPRWSPLAQIIARLLQGQHYDAALTLLAAHPAEVPPQSQRLLWALRHELRSGHSEQARIILTHLGMIDRDLDDLPTAAFVDNQPLLLALTQSMGERSPMRRVMAELVAEAPDFASGMWRAMLDEDSTALEAYLKSHLPGLRQAPPAVQDLLAQLLDQQGGLSDSEVAAWWHSRGILAQQIEALNASDDQALPSDDYTDLLLSVAVHEPSALPKVLPHRARLSDHHQQPLVHSARLRSPSHLMAYLRLLRDPDFAHAEEPTQSQLHQLLRGQFTNGREVEAVARWHQQAQSAIIADLSAIEFAPLLPAMSRMLERDQQLFAWAAALDEEGPWANAWRIARRLVAGDPAATTIAQEALHSDNSSLFWRLAGAQAVLLAPPQNAAVDHALLALWSEALTQGAEVDDSLATYLATRVASNPARHREAVQAMVSAQQEVRRSANGWSQVLAVVAALGDQALAATLLAQPAAAPLGRDLGTYITLLRAGWGAPAAELFQGEWRHLKPSNLQLEDALPAEPMAAFTTAIADPDLRLLAAALLESSRAQGSPGRSTRLSELAQAWAKRRFSGVEVDPLLRQRFVDSCLVEDAPSIDAALAPCLRVLVSDDKLVDELTNSRSIQPRRLALLRHELRQGNVTQAETILAALAGDDAGAWQVRQLSDALRSELNRNQWPAEHLPALRRLLGTLFARHQSRHGDGRLLLAVLIRHAAVGAVAPFTAWCAEHRALLVDLAASNYSHLPYQLAQHRPSDPAAAETYSAELVELLAEPALASLMVSQPNLFAQLLEKQLLAEADLLAEGERLASALPRAGWAWYELARLRAGRADHDGARQAWEQAIAATSDEELRQRWSAELERGTIEDAAGLEQLLTQLSDQLRADFAQKDDATATAPGLLAPDLQLLRHRLAQDDVRQAQRRVAGELATLIRHELAGGELRDLSLLLRLISQQQAGDTVLSLLIHNDPMARLIYARAYELLQPAERAVTVYQQLATDYPELPLIQRRLRAAALRAGDEDLVPELVAESDDELAKIISLADRTAGHQSASVSAHFRLLAQTRVLSAVLAKRPVAGARPAAWAETAVIDFMRGTSSSQPWRVYRDDIHASQREGVAGIRKVHQPLFAALQAYPASSEQAFALQVAAAAATDHGGQPDRWRAAALAALANRAQSEDATAAAADLPMLPGDDAALILPPPVSFLVRLSAADDPGLEKLGATLAAHQQPAIQSQLAAYGKLLAARDEEFLAAADALLTLAHDEAWRVPAILDDIVHYAPERCSAAMIQDWIAAHLASGTLQEGHDLLLIGHWAHKLTQQPAAASAFFAAIETALPRQRYHVYARFLPELSDHPDLLPAIVERLPEMHGQRAMVSHLSIRIRNLPQRTPAEGMALLAGIGLLGDADAAVPAMGRDLPLLAETAQVLPKLSRKRRASYRELLATKDGFLAGVWRELLVAEAPQAERWWGRYSEHLPVLQRASRRVQIALAGLLPPPPQPFNPAHSQVRTWATALNDGHRQQLLQAIAAGEGSAHSWAQQLREQLAAINDPHAAQELLENALAAVDEAQHPSFVSSLSRRWRPSHRENFSGLAPLLTLVRDPRLAPHVSIFSNIENAFFWAIVQTYRDLSGSRLKRLAEIDQLLAAQVNHLESIEALAYPLQFVLGKDDRALDWAAARGDDTALGRAWRLAAGLINGDAESLQRLAVIIADDSLSPHWRIIVARGTRSAHIEALPLATRKSVIPLFNTLVATETSLQPWTQTIILRVLPPVSAAEEEWRRLGDSIARSLARSGHSWHDQVDALVAAAIALDHDDLLQALIAHEQAGLGERSEHYAALVRSGHGEHAAQLWLRRWPQLPADQEGIYDAELAAALPAFLGQVPEGASRSIAAFILSSLPGRVEDGDARARQAAILAAMDRSALTAGERETLLQATIGRLPYALEHQLLGVLQTHLGERGLLDDIGAGGDSGDQLRAWHYARLRGELAAGDSSGLRHILPTFIDADDQATRRVRKQRSLLVGEIAPALADAAAWPPARLAELRELVGELLQLPQDRRRPAPPLLPILISQHRSIAAINDLVNWISTLEQAGRDQLAGSISSTVLVPALAQALSAAEDQHLRLIDALLSAPAFRPVLAEESGLFPELLEADLLSSEQLRTHGQSWASAAPRGGWAWAELANLHHAAGDHPAAAAAWEEAIATASGKLRRRFTRDRDRQRPAKPTPAPANPAPDAPSPDSDRKPQTTPPQSEPPEDTGEGANEF